MALSTEYSVTLAAMDESGSCRNRFATVLTLATMLLALAPAAALAQSPGDQQYADPLAGDDGGDSNGGQGSPAPEPTGPDSPVSSDDGAPAADSAPAAPSPSAGAAEPAATLPRTGVDAGLLAAAGIVLLAGGALLRPRATS